MTIITSTTHVCIEIIDNFLLPSMENWFSDDEVFFFHEDNASCYRAKVNNAFFLQENILNKWLSNSPDLNPTENSWRKLK